ncbi:hypothetical protein [Tessaracoccus oleiagri]|uniref:hypothetical protein n=1 Tax=Tessaracoccus oleiagri TaxID=686624 RepID=UPI000B843EA0|nr:hypothetical protein [Tessaracoccus oleiagri]
MPSSASDLVSSHESAALNALNAAAGDAPLCRSDGTRQGVKEAEGAAAALGDVRRALQRDPGRSPLVVLDEVAGQWRRLDGALAERPETKEYLAGGMEAIEALRADVEAVKPAAGPARAVSLTAPTSPSVSVPARAGKWARRRVVAALVVFGLLAPLVATSGPWDLIAEPLWSTLVLGIAALSSATLALFVPHHGWKPDLGCAPCAITGVLVAIGAPAAVIWNAHDLGWALLGLVVSVFALVRKQLDPGYCGPP